MTDNQAELRSWIETLPECDFSIHNLPFGIIQTDGAHPRPATRIGEYAIDLQALANLHLLYGIGISDFEVFSAPVLNPLISLGRPVWRALRQRLSELFAAGSAHEEVIRFARQPVLIPMKRVEMRMPVTVGDYTDFYSSIEHASNLGKMFRNPEQALLPNWRHIPVGYHGRSSSIVITGTDIHRPKGQTKAHDKDLPDFGPSREMDFELEVAYIVGKETVLGKRVSTSEAEEHIFGLVLFNDLSARDIQRWEYVPLGPFLSKNFGSVISPWIVTLDALEPFRVPTPDQIPEPLPYLKYEGKGNFDIMLEVYLKPENGPVSLISRSNHNNLYWNIFQQLAHHTVNGCNIRVGDMGASGTISGPTPDSFGSMIELAWKGTQPITLADGSTRTFIEDGDTIIFKAYAAKNGIRIGFGECMTKILPATGN